MKKAILYWVLSAAVIIAGAQVMMIASEHYRQVMMDFDKEFNLIEVGIVNSLPLIIYLLTALFCAGICSARIGRDQSPILLIVLIIISAIMIIPVAVQTVIYISYESGIAVFDVRYKNFAYLFAFPLVSLIKVWISGRRD